MAGDALTLIIFGASGDLAARKLIPALYHLDTKRRLPAELRVVGVSRTRYSDDSFRDYLAGKVREFADGTWDEREWASFSRRLHYLAADATRPEGISELQNWLRNVEGDSPGRRLYYLAVAPSLYPVIARQLGEHGMSEVAIGQLGPNAWRRLVVEKPFGHDLASARELNRILRSCFHESQIYRIDHYLGKETVQNILVFRFANTLFEPVWNSNFIDHVQITVSESGTVEGRGDYYDKAGVLRDMFQNHLLQLLTLVAMEAPARFAADPLRNEKVKVLDAIPVYTPEEAAAHVITGQYRGYRPRREGGRLIEGEPHVAPDSRTPTYASIELNIDNWRWKGVPFFLRSGKGLTTRSSEVIIQFRCPPHLMFPLPPGTELVCNRLAMCIQPDEGIHLRFQSKVPDQEAMLLQPADMEFHYHRAFAEKALPEAYERLLQDALQGDAALFMRSDEIERAWEIIDPFLQATERPDAPTPEEYAVGSEGPCCSDAFLQRTGRTWLSLCRHEK